MSNQPSFESTGLALCERQNGLIYQYALSTAWDLLTATYDNININIQDSVPEGMFFNSNGTKLYEIGSGSELIYQYNLK